MNVPEELFTALQEICQARLFPWCWLATSDPARGAQVRTVRMLSYNLRQASFLFASHAQHSKHIQIQHDPRGQLCLLRQDSPLQVRLDVQLKSTPGQDHGLGERLWQKVSPNDRVQLYGAHPRAPQVPPTFYLVEAQTVAADVLRLHPENSSRRRFSQGVSGGWQVVDLHL
jgi:hypothetical protein